MKSFGRRARIGTGIALVAVQAAGNAAASYEVVADVFSRADAGVSVNSAGYTVTLSVGQRCLVGPQSAGGDVLLAPGYQAMIRGLRGVIVLSEATIRERVGAVVGRQRQLYGFVGSLNYDEAKAVVNQRKATREQLVAQLAGLGPGGAKVMAEAYPQSENMREKLMLIEALGRINDPNAAAVLAELEAGGEEFSVHREIIAALGRREEAVAEGVLSELLGDGDYRLGMAAAQGLSGRPGAVTALSRTVESETVNRDVRQEAVRSLGLVGTEEARASLTDLALSPTDDGVRNSAIQELARSYGDESIDSFRLLMADPEESVRFNTVRALARVGTPAATELMRTAATDDPSPEVREYAQAWLDR